MTTYTLTTDAAQEALLSWVVSTFNKEHDSTLTNAQYIALRFPQLLGPFRQQYQDHVAAQINAGFVTADAATQQQVLSLLKVTP